MRVTNAIKMVLARVASPPRRPAFSCGECERWERCGRPPSADCIVMLAQIERDGGRSRMRATLPQWRGSLGC